MKRPLIPSAIPNLSTKRLLSLAIAGSMTASFASAQPATQPVGEAGLGVESVSVTGQADQAVFPAASPERVNDVRTRVFPAVVRLDVAQEVYREGKRSLERGIGSGVIFDEEGRILTNYHVAGRAAEIYVTLANKERVRGTLIGDDHWTDLAVVQLDMDEVREKGITFQHAELAEDDTLVPGQNVIAMGTPFGLARTMTMGIVSNVERTFYPDERDIDGYETGIFNNWIQTDAPIAPGNSGGPLIDLNGHVVGINTRGVPGQDLNFAIPVSTVREVKDAILADYRQQVEELESAGQLATDEEPTTKPALVEGATTQAAEGETLAASNESVAEQEAKEKPKGKVTRAELGLHFKPLQDLEQFYNIDPNRGVLVSNVDRRGPADEAGVRVQDILLSIDGQPTNVRFPEEIAAVRKMIADLPIGKTVELRVLRGGEEVTLSAETTRLQSRVGEERELRKWGLSVRDVTRTFANQAQLDDDEGVVVTTTRSGFPADNAELGRGDIIKQINGQPATDLETFMKLYRDSVADQKEKVLLTVARRQGTRSVLLKVEYED